MTEEQAIEVVHGMDRITKARCYLEYFINELYYNYSSDYYRRYPHMIMTSEQFLGEDNIHHVDIGETWKERGFAQQKWINLTGIYHWVQKELKHI